MSASKFFRLASPSARTRVLSAVLGLSLLAPVAFTQAACGSKTNDGVLRANVKAGDMPEGADWTGVYFSQLYGYLHLVKEGKTISGKWRTANGDAWGELHGEVIGDLMHFEWTEHKIGMVGPSATSTGKGYFKYVRPESNDSDKIVGEWGLGANEAGNPWDAVKQQNMMPDPDSVMPDELERRGSGGGWDEAPTPPAGGGGDEGGDEGGADEGGGDEGGEGGPPGI